MKKQSPVPQSEMLGASEEANEKSQTMVDYTSSGENSPPGDRDYDNDDSSGQAAESTRSVDNEERAEERAEDEFHFQYAPSRADPVEESYPVEESSPVEAPAEPSVWALSFGKETSRKVAKAKRSRNKVF